MSDKSTVSVQVGPGFFGLLALLFIGLRLGDVIDWSWFWVLAPLWLPLGLLLMISAAWLIVKVFIVRRWF